MNWRITESQRIIMNQENASLLDRLLRCESDLKPDNMTKHQERQERLLSQISSFDKDGKRKVPFMTQAMRKRKLGKLMSINLKLGSQLKLDEDSQIANKSSDPQRQVEDYNDTSFIKLKKARETNRSVENLKRMMEFVEEESSSED